MPAIISGIIFNDLNSNGVYNAGEPGIANAFVVLRDTVGNCTQVQSDGSGNYSFSNITVAGAYTIYETVTTPNACPPTQFTQPTGFNESTTPRQINLTVTATQITNNTTISGNNFGHDNLTPNGCTPFAYQVQGSPTTFTQIDLKTGTTTTLGTLNPSTTFAGTGYNKIDGNFWGCVFSSNVIGRITANRTVTLLPAVPNLASTNYNCGDVDANGYLYIYSGNAASFFVIDVNPNRVTYGRLVNPASSYQEQTVAPFGVTISSPQVISDWAFNPQDGQLYGVNNSGIAFKVNPITGVVTTLTTSPIVAPASAYGASFFDNNNNLYEVDNSTGQIFRYAISGTTATRTFYSTSVAASTNDGARCATAPITFAFLSSTKSTIGNVGIGDTFTYTVAIKNTGNETSINCLFIDTVPNGASFVSNTLKVNGVSKSGSPEPPGIELGSIPVGTTTVTFDVTVLTIPTPNAMKNNSTQSYSYQDGTGGGIYNENAYSNSVATTVNYVFLPVIKTVDKTDAAIGDQITYTVVTRNTGNFTASNLFIIDTIPNGTSYVGGSLTGGTGSPATGITVGTLAAGATSTVTFKVTVDTIPSPNPIPNVATATITYIPNPTTGTVRTEGNSTNTVNTIISQAEINGLTKTSSPGFAKVGDTITYTLTFKNTGNATATAINFIDTIPSGTTFVNNSLFVNGTAQTGLSPAPPGVTIPDLSPNWTTTITFNVIVNTIPSPNVVPNQGKITYSFFTITIPKQILSNNVVTTINMAQLLQSKQVNKDYASVGAVLTYTIPITNIGNVTANNVVFIDTIPNGTSLVLGSFKQDGAVISASPNPPGATLVNIGPNTTSTIVFQVNIDIIPSPNPIPNSASTQYDYTVNPSTPNDSSGSTNTNIVNTQVNNANLSGITKYVDKAYADCGESINYTIVIPNTGNVTANNVLFKDTIPNGTVFVANSVYINDIQQPGANPVPGLSIPSIAPYSTTTLTFTVLVQC